MPVQTRSQTRSQTRKQLEDKKRSSNVSESQNVNSHTEGSAKSAGKASSIRSAKSASSAAGSARKTNQTHTKQQVKPSSSPTPSTRQKDKLTEVSIRPNTSTRPNTSINPKMDYTQQMSRLGVDLKSMIYNATVRSRKEMMLANLKGEKKHRPPQYKQYGLVQDPIIVFHDKVNYPNERLISKTSEEHKNLLRDQDKVSSEIHITLLPNDMILIQRQANKLGDDWAILHFFHNLNTNQSIVMFPTAILSVEEKKLPEYYKTLEFLFYSFFLDIQFLRIENSQYNKSFKKLFEFDRDDLAKHKQILMTAIKSNDWEWVWRANDETYPVSESSFRKAQNGIQKISQKLNDKEAWDHNLIFFRENKTHINNDERNAFQNALLSFQKFQFGDKNVDFKKKKNVDFENANLYITNTKKNNSKNNNSSF